MRSTKNIINSILSGIVNELKKVLPLFRESDPLDKTAEQAFAVAIAPEIKQLERLGVEATKQGCPLTASSKRDSSIGALEDWGDLFLERRPIKPVGGRYKATFTGTGTAAAGTQYLEQNTGFVFILESEVSAAGDGIIQSVGNENETLLNVGDELFAQQNTGLDSSIIINEILTYPEDEETTENYRADILEAIRITPHGGAKGDYILWAKEVAGIFKAFPYTEIDKAYLYLMQLRTESNPTGEATLDNIEDVEDVLIAKDVMASGEIIVQSVIVRTYDITVSGLTDPAKESLIQPALDEYFEAKYPFISGIDNENARTDRVTKAEILKTIYDAVFPASISDAVIEVDGLEINDEYLPQGNIGEAEVTVE